MPDAVTTYYSNTSTGVAEMKDSIFEDVDGTIQDITPKETPFLASIGKSKAKNVLHEWMEDSLTAPSSILKAVEGADATSTARTAPVRKSNYCQILQDTFTVSGTLQATDTIGRTLPAYEIQKSLKKLSQHLEYTAINSTAAAAGDGSTARQMNGLAGFISTNDKSYASYSASNDFDEAKLLAMAQACWEAGGEPSHLLVNGAVARKIGGWNQSNRITVNADQGDKRLVMAIVTIETPYGDIRIIKDRYIAPTADSGSNYVGTFLYDPSKIKMAYLRNMKTSQLAKTGDSDKFQSVVECTLQVANETAHAKALKCSID